MGQAWWPGGVFPRRLHRPRVGGHLAADLAVPVHGQCEAHAGAFCWLGSTPTSVPWVRRPIKATWLNNGTPSFCGAPFFSDRPWRAQGRRTGRRPAGARGGRGCTGRVERWRISRSRTLAGNEAETSRLKAPRGGPTTGIHKPGDALIPRGKRAGRLRHPGGPGATGPRRWGTPGALWPRVKRRGRRLPGAGSDEPCRRRQALSRHRFSSANCRQCAASTARPRRAKPSASCSSRGR